MKIPKMQIMKLPDLFKRKKNKNQEPDPENVICKNCNTKFSGHFCPECGQAFREFDKPFSFIFYNFVGDFFSFDTRFFKTIAYLLFYPGKLTNEFFAGRRIRYAPPFRIYIFVSFVLFFLLQMLTNRGINSVLDTDLIDKNIITMDSASVSVADSLLAEMNIIDDTISVGKTGRTGLNVDENKNNNLRGILNTLATQLESDLETETSARKRARLQEFIRLCRSPREVMAKILEYTSWAFFLLLPLFALLLKLFYIRRNQNYIRHLIYSVHIHSFIFIGFIFLILLKLLFGSVQEFIILLVLVSIPIYFVVSLKNVYGQKWGKVIGKFLGISVLYSFVFWIVIIFVFLNALSLA